MRLFCRLCGTRTDGRERLGTYCPGEQCGADQRFAGDTETGVQAWCEPARQRGEPGEAVTVRLTVRNAGRRPDTYRVEPIEQVAGRLDFDAASLTYTLAPGESRVVVLRYTPPRDHIGFGIDIASRFGIAGAEAAGRANDTRGGRFGVALRIVSTSGTTRAAAGAAFAIDIPRRFQYDPNRGDPRGGVRPKLLAGVGAAAVIVALAVVAAVALGGSDGGGTPAAPGPGVEAVTVASVDPGVGGTGRGGDTSGSDDPDGSNGSNGENGGTISGRGGGTAGSGANAGNGGKPGPGTTPPTARRDFVVPNTSGMTTQEAKDAIAKAGLAPSIQPVPNSRGPQGAVIDTYPAGGEIVGEGSTVVVRVHDGNTTVPNVVGMDQETARTTLRDAGLAARFTTVAVGDRTKYNVVVRTDPPAGTSAGVLTGVTVYLGTADIR
ncbi:PASTA domain-containing protein [Uniformispora flossi]|uniref:PASTA domain-containing protein n=1 Tax=Uniformispora flossi TaxID=3390723 RepID=UPI003C2AEF68